MYNVAECYYTVRKGELHMDRAAFRELQELRMLNGARANALAAIHGGLARNWFAALMWMWNSAP